MKWFKKKERPIPENATCRNCGVQILGRYCHECGQDVFAGVGIPILKLLAQVLDNVFALEGKTPRTLAHLMIRPGFLSEEYLNGKVSRYVHPVKLFWMATLIFLALSIYHIDKINWRKEFIENIKDNKGDDNTKTFVIKSENVYDNEVKKQKLAELLSMIPHLISKFAPYVAFLLIPFFALLLALYFRRKKYYYIHHLIFTIHFHTFLWIFCSFLLIVSIFVSLEIPDWLSLILFFTPGIYFIFALHRFYQTRTWWQAMWKSVVITIFYLFLASTITIFFVYFVLKIYFPELSS
jgi:hypothetical protein